MNKVFAHPNHPTPSKNLPTIDALNQLAQSENLNVAAGTADIKRMGVTYIHNKGVLVDGNKTLISSINWDSNAVLNNREAAVVITGSDVFDHYETLFNGDWQTSMGSRGAAQHPAFASLQQTEVRTASDICPNRLRVSVQIGELRISDDDGASFDSLSNTHFTSDFVRTPGSHTCVLTDTRGSGRTGKNRFIEIRKRADGARSAALEGYTPDGKLYSIRTTLDGGGPYDGQYDAFVFDASGPSREKLGTAVLDIETKIGMLR